VSEDAYILAAVWAITSFIMLFAISRMEASIRKERDKMYDERIEWRNERKELTDRIMAPSFDHLKQAEIRIIKAQKEEPPVKYELV
jgi:uncharacterized membrane protein YhiD involved in acid resistance